MLVQAGVLEKAAVWAINQARFCLLKNHATFSLQGIVKGSSQTGGIGKPKRGKKNPLKNILFLDSQCFYCTTFDEFFSHCFLNAVRDFQKPIDQPAQRQISKDLKEQEDHEQDVEDEPDKVETEVATISTQTEEVKPPTPEAEEEPPELEARETQVRFLLTISKRVLLYTDTCVCSELFYCNDISRI